MDSDETQEQKKGINRNTIIAIIGVVMLLVGCCGAALLFGAEEAAPEPTETPFLAGRGDAVTVSRE